MEAIVVAGDLLIAIGAIALLLLCGLVVSTARSRRSLRHANERLRARVEERTAQLASSEARIRVVIESSLDALVVLDGDGIVLEWNPRAEQLLGISRAETVGRTAVRERFPPKTWAHQHEAHARYAETGDPSVFNARLEDLATHSDGRRIPVEVTVSAALIGDELMISGCIRDITERTRDRAEIEDARDAAERATHAKSAFLATMSHEIRTPMNAIVGMTSLLRDSTLDPEQRRHVETVRMSGDQLLAVINDILDFSKIESGKLELESHAFALREVIESSLDLLAPQAAVKELDLGYLLETDGSTRLIGDSTRLRQILINFLSNAVKFTNRGSVTIHGRLTALGAGSEERAHLRLEVRDSGIGIPPDRLPTLFESFTQVDASVTRRYGGTGLGLAITKRLTEAMGGLLSVRSTPGEGSTFAIDVTLPRVPGDDPVDADVPELLNGCRALVVDDNAVNRELLQAQLGSWSMDTTSLERPADAIALVRGGEWFDVAILDMAMPEIDGLRLADALAEATGYTLPIVLLSSIGGVDPALARGRLAATLSKPVKPVTLRNALATAVAGDAATPAAVAADAAPPAPTLGRPLHILVAEDNIVNQQVAVATLERLGHRVDVAADGLEALAAVHRQDYDLVLMDVQMPNLDGLEATRRIRAELEPARQPRIVAMTANASTEDRDACAVAGMDDFLLKPVPREDMVRVLSSTVPFAMRGIREQLERLDVAADGDGDGEDDPPIVDADRFSAATGGDDALAELLIDLHEEEGTALIARLRSAVERSDVDQLRLTAHTLKSASANIGAMQLARLSESLEQAAIGGSVDDPSGRVDEIVDVFGHTQVVLDRFRSQH